MVNAKEIFRDEEAREVTRQVYAALGDAAKEIANGIHFGGKFNVEVTLEMRSEDAYDDNATFRVTVNNVGY